MEKYLMAIDAGTGSVRVILFNTLGKELYVAQSEWTHKEDVRYPGSMDFDIVTNIAIITNLIKETITNSRVNPEDILAISTTSMREAIVLYDETGKELWACANVDSRSNNEVSNLYNISDTIESDLYKISGQTFSLAAIPRILWVKNNLPETYDKIKYVTMLNDWITYRLSDVISVEPSNGCTSGLFDIKKRTWDSNIAKNVNLREDIFPIVHESGTVIGQVTKEMSTLTGLSPETLVVAGGGDAQLGCIGAGVINEGDAAVFGGSFWQYEYTTNNVQIDDECRVRINCHAVPNTWQYEAIAFFPGLVMRWFRDSFCEFEKHFQKETGESVYVQMEKRARDVPPGSYGMLATFSDVMNYKSWKHAAPSFLNFQLDSEKFNKVSFYRAIMENAAFVTKGNIELVNDITNTSPESIVFAGGASKSELWCQIVSDVLNKPLRVPVVRESTALGAAICAGVGANVYNNFDDAIAKVIQFEKTYYPIKENNAVYEELYKKWKEIYKKQLELADNDLTEHMWIAPGIK
ncbi:autoinducer-2 kinase [Robertmurraya andreesenii]|uniref:Autoinducer 2 (AI-2) kinase n=1 Tax=Anoxybacillus andreesenii TaxID=1325932 RepID=A0ABT9V3B2_9BACL|nr:autoinducer-2 kinase [Robertmurraya andreesenii]MDQ0155431.1 autoinducer 2 (AI-2) kinase [Robertmurraya andreesenii]